MAAFSFVLHYVNDPQKCAAFYADLLGIPVIEATPTFAMLPLREGVMLGLWLASGVQPAPNGTSSAAEIAFVEKSRAEVDATHASWAAKGAKITQAPTTMDFGYTFSAVDPDGHRLRVLFPED